MVDNFMLLDKGEKYSLQPIAQQVKKCLDDMDDLEYKMHSAGEDNVLFEIEFKEALNESKDFTYSLLLLPSENIEALRFLSKFMIREYEEEEFKLIWEYFHHLNKTILLGNVFVEKEDAFYGINYRYGITLIRDGHELTVKELEEIFMYVSFVIDKILKELGEREE